nr:methyltransferase [Brevundimonas variabilis]
MPEITPDTTENALLDGRVRLRQPIRGYRAGMDAALLAAAVEAKPGERIIEAGCGAGAVLTQIAARCPGVSLTGIELDPAASRLARQNAALNEIEARMEIMDADIASGFRTLALPTFDWAISNPPFFDDEAALRPPAPEKRGAWMAVDGLAVWTDFLVRAVHDGGRIVMIHRADRLADILHLLGQRCGSITIQPVHPFSDTPAKRVVVRAIRAGKAPLSLLPPLILHQRLDGKHSAWAEAILRGRAVLSMS